MLESIEIERYRGIREGKMSGFGPVNILVGKNGSGKSTVLEAIYAVAIQCGADVPSFQKLRGGSFPAPNHFYGHDTRQRVAIKLRTAWGHDIVLHLSGSGPATMGNPPRFNTNLQPTYEQLKQAAAGDFFANMQILSAARLLGAEGQRVEQAAYPRVVRARGDRLVSRVIAEVYGLDVEGFTYVPDVNGNLVLEAQEKSKAFSLDVDDYGSGIRAAIRLLFLTALAPKSALLVEELDAYQHISALEKLAVALLRLSDEQKTQFFLTTHSLETVLAFAAADRQLGKKLVRVFQTDLAPDGTFRSGMMPSEDAAQLASIGDDIRKV